jgi:pimeloyl-ACP methyl ester carboxylesterase
MGTITTKDGTEIYNKDWGSGPVITFSHGWPLSSDAWDVQMLFLARNGFRVVAHDRRGHDAEHTVLKNGPDPSQFRAKSLLNSSPYNRTRHSSCRSPHHDVVLFHLD